MTSSQIKDGVRRYMAADGICRIVGISQCWKKIRLWGKPNLA